MNVKKEIENLETMKIDQMIHYELFMVEQYQSLQGRKVTQKLKKDAEELKTIIIATRKRIVQERYFNLLRAEQKSGKMDLHMVDHPDAIAYANQSKK